MPPHRILFAEDNPDHAFLIRRCLEPLGMELHHAANGEEALEQLRSWRGEAPAFVLLDVNLPRLDGVAVLERLRTLGGAISRVPVVVFSTSRLKADRERAYLAGANSYVAKPASFGQFRTVLSGIARYWTEHHLRKEGPRLEPRVPE